MTVRVYHHSVTLCLHSAGVVAVGFVSVAVGVHMVKHYALSMFHSVCIMFYHMVSLWLRRVWSPSEK